MSRFRLDHISKFKPGTVEKMTEIRQKYIDLEAELEKLLPCIYDDNAICMSRVADGCLTHLEQSLSYAIKLLCLKGEDRTEQEKER